jgi:crossover junction endodeoxyribonuclease RuvC
MAQNYKIILGIDPGYATLGWGVVKCTGSEFTHIAHGVIVTPKDEGMGQRLCEINNDLTEIIETYKPDEIAIEELFFAKNAKTAINVAHARGIIMMRAVYHSGRIFEYKPNQVKQATTGTGAADKKQIQFMVQRILGLSEIPKPDDAADALAIAITHGVYSR